MGVSRPWRPTKRPPRSGPSDLDSIGERSAGTKDALQRPEALQLAAAGLALGEMLLHHQRSLERELSIEVGVKCDARMFVPETHSSFTW
jgi:hypothetical protein